MWARIVRRLVVAARVLMGALSLAALAWAVWIAIDLAFGHWISAVGNRPRAPGLAIVGLIFLCLGATGGLRWALAPFRTPVAVSVAMLSVLAWLAGAGFVYLFALFQWAGY